MPPGSWDAPPPAPPPPPPPGWPPQATPGDWSAPGYGDWGPPHRNGLGTAALVLGILSVPFALFIVPGFLLGILALVLGLVGRGRVKRREATNRGVATAGAVLGAIGLVLAVAWGTALVAIGFHEQRQYDRCVTNGGTVTECHARYLD
jgi:hypothetical protein